MKDVISRICSKASIQISLDEQDSCALFLPTIKSKTGIFMEREKILKSFHLPNRVNIYFFLILKI